MFTAVDADFGSLVSQWQSTSVFYHPCMPVGNDFSHVCVSVFVCVCVSVKAITYEPLYIETSFLVCR